MPDLIYSYTRAQAIEDGMLVDLMPIAGDVVQQHYKYPMACTAVVWGMIEQAVENPKWCNDVKGIVHDLCRMARYGQTLDDSTRLFECIITGIGRKRIYRFKLVCGPGDDAKPVLTLMLPEED